MTTGEVITSENEIGLESVEWIESQGRMFIYMEGGSAVPIQIIHTVDGIETIYLPQP